jgi:hypothetical protein
VPPKNKTPKTETKETKTMSFLTLRGFCLFGGTGFWLRYLEKNGVSSYFLISIKIFMKSQDRSNKRLWHFAQFQTRLCPSIYIFGKWWECKFWKIVLSL